MQRNVDPQRQSYRFLVRDNENNLPATTPSIAFLNQLQDELLSMTPKTVGFDSSLLASKNEQVITGIESVKHGYSFPNIDSQHRIELKRGSAERKSLPLPTETFAVHVLTEVYQRVLISQLETPLEIGPVVIAKRDGSVEFSLKDGLESGFLYVILESTFLHSQHLL